MGSLGRCLIKVGLIDIAYDVAIVAAAKHLLGAERIYNEAGKRESACLDSEGLALAAHKTEAVLTSSSIFSVHSASWITQSTQNTSFIFENEQKDREDIMLE